jgi:hypothetical protein
VVLVEEVEAEDAEGEEVEEEVEMEAEEEAMKKEVENGIRSLNWGVWLRMVTLNF